MGRTERTVGIAPFDRLVWQVMTKGSGSPRAGCLGSSTTAPITAGQASTDRLQGRCSNLILIHTPVHASWHNQAEIYHSSSNAKYLSSTT
jgi:hypothetical protein